MSDFEYKVKNKDKNKFEFSVTVSKEKFNEVYEKVLKEKSGKIKLPGFRPGKAPRIEVEKRIATEVIDGAINKLLPDITYQIIIKEDLNPISGVKYDLNGIEKEGEITYSFAVVNSPEIDIAKLSALSIPRIDTDEIKDDEITTVVKSLVQTTLKKEEWSNEDGSEKEITDEMVSKLGYEDEKSIKGLREKIKETLKRVKEEQNENAYVSNVLKSAVEIVDFYIPEDLIENEVHHKEHHFEERIQELGLDRDTYLKAQNKTIDQLREEWKKEVEQNAGVDILTISLARSENLIPTEKELEEEIEKIQDEVTKIRYKTDDRLKEQMRTILARNKGISKIIELNEKK